jgi:hypothetical protein
LQGAQITLNEYLGNWVETAVKPRVPENLLGLRRHVAYVRHNGLNSTAGNAPFDLQTTYQQMVERGLSGREFLDSE